MRVKVQYSAKLEDVPREVDGLRLRTVDCLKSQLEKLSKLDLKEIDLSSMEEVVEIRKELFDVDALLGDIDAIVRGYCNLRFSSHPINEDLTTSGGSDIESIDD